MIECEKPRAQCAPGAFHLQRILLAILECMTDADTGVVDAAPAPEIPQEPAMPAIDPQPAETPVAPEPPAQEPALPENPVIAPSPVEQPKDVVEEIEVEKAAPFEPS